MIKPNQKPKSLHPKVAFLAEFLKKCFCPECPVEAFSQCTREKERQADFNLPEKTARLYCASGKAACLDLNFSQICICGSCPVWHKHKLVDAHPSLYFCRDGQAK